MAKSQRVVQASTLILAFLMLFSTNARADAFSDSEAAPRLNLHNFDNVVRAAVRDAYTGDKANLLWFDDNGLTERGNTALITMLKAELEGLDQPGLHRFVRRMRRVPALDDQRTVRADAHITARLVALGMRMQGLDRLRYRNADLAEGYRKPDADIVLATVQSTPNPLQLLSKWQPKSESFRAMLAAAEKYRAFAKQPAWPVLLGQGLLELGDADPEIGQLKARLLAEGYGPEAGFDSKGNISATTLVAGTTAYQPQAPTFATAADSHTATDARSESSLVGAPVDPAWEFTEELAEALMHYQSERGLEVDGVLGPNTRDSLNISPRQRLRQLQWNLIRRRSLPHDLGDHYVWVNIPEYKLRIVKNGNVSFRSRVVVGKRQHKTPIFIDHIEYMEVNPYWNVPQSIAAKEIAPAMRRDPSYIARKDMEVLDGWHAGAQIIAPNSIDWEAYRGWSSGLPFRIRQRPGDKNALGRVKFIFPNDFSVYLHDTPADKLFAETRRSFSHGCVRVEKPFELAEYLLANNRASRSVDFKTVLDSRRNIRFNLDTPLPVYLVYFSAWVDEAGRVQFRDDLYGHDQRLASALSQEVAQLKALGFYREVVDASAESEDLIAGLSDAIVKKRTQLRNGHSNSQ